MAGGAGAEDGADGAGVADDARPCRDNTWDDNSDGDKGDDSACNDHDNAREGGASVAWVAMADDVTEAVAAILHAAGRKQSLNKTTGRIKSVLFSYLLGI